MLTHCPFCQKSLELTNEQNSRLEQALSQLLPGKILTMKCPLCRSAITLDKTGFPPQNTASQVLPPPPPNLEWLKSGLLYTLPYR